MTGRLLRAASWLAWAAPAVLLGAVTWLAVLAPGTAWQPWGACPATPAMGSVCWQPPEVPSHPATDVLAAAAGHSCRPVADWPRGTVPAAALMRTDTGYRVLPFTQAWQLATAGQAWTVLLCSTA